jgi:hypothetical protein
MDVLTGRKTAGRVEGDIFVGGFPKDQHTWSRVCGYVEQSDIHSARTTVREALVISATLRCVVCVGGRQVQQTAPRCPLPPLVRVLTAAGFSCLCACRCPQAVRDARQAGH